MAWNRRRGMGLATLVAAVIVSGCSNDSVNLPNTGEGPNATPGGQVAEADPVTLKWMLGGPGKQQDSDRVWAEFNERLQAYLPNTTVEFEIVPFSEYRERWQLMSASQERVDLAWHGYVMPLADEVSKGAYLPLNELINEHAPELLETIPQWVFDLVTFDGDIYAVPNYQQMTDLRLGMRTPKELADEFLDKEKAEEIFFAREATPLDQASYDVLSEYFEKLKQAGRIQKGVSDAIWTDHNKGIILANPYVIPFDDKTYTVSLADELPERILQQQVAREWFQKGYVREDILSNTNRRQDEGKPDGYIAYFHENFEGQSLRESGKRGFPVEVVAMQKEFQISRLNSATNTAIARQSKHPDRAMQLLSLIQSEEGKELYRLLVNGIEGEHYTVVSENRIELTDFGETQDTAQHPYSLPKWVVGNTFNAYETQFDEEGWNDYVLELHETATIHLLVGFQPDLESVRTELAQISAINQEYLLTEYSTRPLDEIRAEKVDRIERAGGNRVKELLQEQVDAFLAEKGINKSDG
ncbi:DUF3502 domain-containing protein [Paenibacillus daejeonensis]|uniref:DUF3502 domain-containing protein n=1 Tax=Paenibacillus daejeonensis TaxID=135193 RepID=UPI0003A39C43|nr:extracellular solute-binding protein [Paenibacillus daejeonensis]